MVQYGGTQAQTETLAIVALVLGIAGLVVFPLVFSIPAIIVGKKAQEKITASGGTLKGVELAKAGVICGWIGTALALVGIVFLIGFAILASANMG